MSIDNTAVRERNEWLWMHNEARLGRPHASTMHHLSRLYPDGVRFRVHTERLKVQSGTFTFFKPVIEVMMYVKKRFRWVTYMWLDHEGTFAP